MYSQNFGLTQDPFSIAPDPRYLFMSERHREALAHLLYGVAGVTGPHGAAVGTGGGFVLLTGEIGTGKTTICRCFLEQIPAGCHVAYIFNPKLSATELLQSICEEFRINVAPAASSPPTVKDYIDPLNAFLLNSHAAGQSSVLIIDEAQNLKPDVLEQLRLLTNLETNERKLLQIVLIGQPELRAMLARPELEQLAQRVMARFHLDALTEFETTQYIAHRLAVAGHTGALPFDAPALQRIHRLARGVPRRINLLCGRALLGAWANGLQRVDRKVVDKAAAEVFGPDNVAMPAAHPRRASYALGGLAVLAGAALTGFMLWNAPHTPAQATRLPPQAAAPAPPAGAASSAPAQPLLTLRPALLPVEAVETLWPNLPQDLNIAWRELGGVWKLPASDGDPCQAATAQQLHCYRASGLSLPLLSQLGRPGILTLQAASGKPVYALLIGLNEQTATLQIAGQRHNVRRVTLGQWWRGDFATYWRAPPAYRPELQIASQGPAIRYLAHQLSLLDGLPAPQASPAPPRLDEALRARVRDFQRAHGLAADGQPGPLTFMQIDNAAGVAAPRLQTD
ncbi:AAA family ATPase [Polaromonas sp. CG_9.5]|uniref:AAA family ATPase n=1 Tax=Polaromonas sp. CG_9.5 TaxID=3071705 RepID=UPI003FA39B5C